MNEEGALTIEGRHHRSATGGASATAPAHRPGMTETEAGMTIAAPAPAHEPTPRATAGGKATCPRRRKGNGMGVTEMIETLDAMEVVLDST